MKINVFRCSNYCCLLVNMEHRAVITVATSGEANVSSIGDLRDDTSAITVIVTDHLTYHYLHHP